MQNYFVVREYTPFYLQKQQNTNQNVAKIEVT